MQCRLCWDASVRDVSLGEDTIGFREILQGKDCFMLSHIIFRLLQNVVSIICAESETYLGTNVHPAKFAPPK
jgi:hypothetical protein